MKKKILLGLILALIVVGAFLAWQFLGPVVKAPENKYFYVKTGSSLEQVKNDLHSEKIIPSTTWFNLAADAIGYEQVRAGRYEIKNGMSIVNLVRMLRNGTQTPVNFVITKIRTKEVLAARLGKAFECDSSEVMAFLNNPDSLRQFDLDSNKIMAIALPLTYTIRWNTKPGYIFNEFYTAYKNFWNETRLAKAEEKGFSPVEISTIASIVDEETNAASDKPYVASVYINRMEEGMPLQADPTVKFALKDFSIKRVRSVHTDYKSPFNTYQNRGLPPGPICTPALSTIDSVLNAPKTDYIYFVASSAFDGSHIFTSNYKEHMKYARIYHQELNKRNIR